MEETYIFMHSNAVRLGRIKVLESRAMLDQSPCEAFDNLQQLSESVSVMLSQHDCCMTVL